MLRPASGDLCPRTIPPYILAQYGPLLDLILSPATGFSRIRAGYPKYRYCTNSATLNTRLHPGSRLESAPPTRGWTWVIGQTGVIKCMLIHTFYNPCLSDHPCPPLSMILGWCESLSHTSASDTRQGFSVGRRRNPNRRSVRLWVLRRMRKPIQ